MTAQDMERTLEAGARRGSVQATLALLKLRERREQPAEDARAGVEPAAEAVDLADPFLQLEAAAASVDPAAYGRLLPAELTAEQRAELLRRYDAGRAQWQDAQDVSRSSSSSSSMHNGRSA